MQINTLNIIIYILIMASVTYLLRMLPIAIFKNKIQNNFVKSFLFYIPYAVLTAMTIPDIFFCTATLISAIVGLVVAIVLAWYKKGLVVVALLACVAVFVTEQILAFVN